METFTEVRDFVDNPHYHEQRQESLRSLDIGTIDAPIVEIVSGFARLPYCFTLQICYGHFLHTDQRDPRNLEVLPVSNRIRRVQYRIAYIALGIQNSEVGRALFRHLRELPAIDPEYIQFGCADWFWERQVNSYVLQVEPRRHMTKDKAFVGYQEALYIEKLREEFFNRLGSLVQEALAKGQWSQGQ